MFATKKSKEMRGDESRRNERKEEYSRVKYFSIFGLL